MSLSIELHNQELHKSYSTSSVIMLLNYVDLVKRTMTLARRGERKYIFRFRLPPQCKWYLLFSGILRNVDRYLVTYVSGQSIASISKYQIALDCFTPKDGTDRLYRNASDYQLMLLNIAEERRSQGSTHNTGVLEGSFCVQSVIWSIFSYRGADKSLARPGKKETTATKI